MIGIMKRPSGLFLIVLLAFVSLSSLCKKPNDDDYLEPTNVSNSHGRSENPSIAVDLKNTVHLVWDDDTYGNEEILYEYKHTGGSWSAPINISNNSESSRLPSIIIDRHDILHVAWQQQKTGGQWEILYCCKDTTNAWSIQETISVYGSSLQPKLAVDNNLGLHLIWLEGFSPDQCLLYYAYKPFGDTWHIQYLVTTHICDYEMKTDLNNGVHIVLDPYSETYYMEKKPDGAWTDTVRLSHTPMEWPGSSFSSVAVDDNGVSHVIWAEADTAFKGFVYIKGKSASLDSWSTPVSPYKNNYNWQLAISKIDIGRSGKIYVVWRDERVGIGYGIKDGETWTQPRIIVKRGAGEKPSMAIDIQERIHYAWESYDSLSLDNEEIYYVEFVP